VISAELALGETSSTAYRGDRGKTAFDHVSATDNPHSVSKAQVGLSNVPNTDFTSSIAAKVSKTGNETVAGVKTFSSSPIVPAPTTDLQAATKKYVDDNGGGGGTNTKVYNGSFVITSTGAQSISGLPFEPNQVTFRASLPVDAENLAGKAGDSASDDTGFAGNMFGFARNDGSTTTQQAMSTGGSGASINNVRYGASDSKAIYATYGDGDAAEVAQLEGTVSSWNADGFTLNIDTYSSFSAGMAGQVVQYTAYRSEELATAATNVSDDGSTIAFSVGDINFGSNLSVLDNGDNTVTVNANSGGGGITWNEVTGTTQAASVNAGYIANNAALVTITIPTTAAVGDVVRVTGKGVGGWKIAQNASEIIHFLGTDTTTGTGGSLASTGTYDGVEIVCVVANTEWVVISSMGNITIV
jgi:hypothetical protein